MESKDGTDDKITFLLGNTEQGKRCIDGNKHLSMKSLHFETVIKMKK